MHVFVSFPFIALLNKELLTQLRSGRSYILLLLLLIVSGGVAWAFWPDTRNISWALLPGAASTLTTSVSFVLLCGSALFVPGMAGTSIAQERENDTWEAVISTLIRPSGIIAAKWMSSVGMYIIFLIAMTPIMSVGLFLAGVDWGILTRSFLTIIATAASCGVVGVAASAMFRRTIWAVVFSYAGMLVIMGLPGLVLTIFDELTGIRHVANEIVIAATSPLFVIFDLQTGLFMQNYYWVHLVYQIVIVVAAIVCATVAMKRESKSTSIRTPKIIRDHVVLKSRRRTFPFYLADPTCSKPDIRDRTNPMLFKETWWGLFPNQSWYIRAMYGVPIFFFMYSWGIRSLGISSAKDFISTALLWHGLVIGLAIPIMFCNLYTRDHRQGNVDMIRMTLMSPAGVVNAKLLAALRISTYILVVSALCNFGVAGIVWKSEAFFSLSFFMYGSMALCILIAVLLTAFSSLRSKSTGGALIRSYLSIFILFFGGLAVAVMLMLVYQLRNGTLPNPWGDILTFLSPVFGTLTMLSRPYDSTGLIRWILNILEFSTFGLGVYLYSIYYYWRKVMRTQP